MTRISMRRLLALAACVASLSGCALVDLMEPVPAAEPSVPESASGQGTPPGQQASLPPGQPAPPPAPPPAVKPVAPKMLVGMTPDEVRALIGDPVSERSNPPAEVWTWRHGACEVDVFFYLDLGTQTFRALTFEFRGAKHSESKCLGALKDEKDRGRRAQN